MICKIYQLESNTVIDNMSADSSSSSLVTRYSLQTQHSACSVEHCHHPHHGHITAVGTYQLDQDTGSRHGQIILVTLSSSAQFSSNIGVETSCGVLDMKWSGHETPVLAVAESSGHLSLYRVTSELRLSLVTRVQVVESGLSLALEWSDDHRTVIVSDSGGHVTLFRLVNDAALEQVTRIHGHGFEAWTVCLSKHDSNIFYSGGDDCKLNCYDIRVSESSAVRSNKSSHSMGVTSMICDQRRENILITGSYDEHVRVWDVRNIKYEQQCWSVGGGVWRIKPHNENPDLLLIAAMHDGFKILDHGDIVQEYREHESLAYGADWVTQMKADDENTQFVATCSFYDKMFKVWSYSI